jgi:hypothetical protein
MPEIPVSNPRSPEKPSQSNVNETTKKYDNPELNITFDYPAVLEEELIDVESRNKAWAEEYKGIPEAKQPLYTADFITTLRSPGIESYPACIDGMFISVNKYPNPLLKNQLDSIRDITEHYAKYPNTDPKYEEKFQSLQLPIGNSSVFEDVLTEDFVKIVIFNNKDMTYEFRLSGGCNTAGRYTDDVEEDFDILLQSIKSK